MFLDRLLLVLKHNVGLFKVFIIIIVTTWSAYWMTSTASERKKKTDQIYKRFQKNIYL